MKAQSIKQYLKLYNGFQLLGWLLALILCFVDKELFISTILLFQIISLLEIIHAYKKWNNSSTLLTATQILARLFILLLIYVEILTHIFQSMHAYFYNVMNVLLLLWCFAEIIRFAYYLNQSFNLNNKIITWLRYSAFIVVYPLGVALEFYIIYISFVDNSSIFIKSFLVIVVCLYVYMFPKLYYHLIKQRKKVLQ